MILYASLFTLICILIVVLLKRDSKKIKCPRCQTHNVMVDQSRNCSKDRELPMMCGYCGEKFDYKW